MTDYSKFRRKPDWLKVPLARDKKYIELKSIVKKNQLHTICESGNCPNMGECWNAGTATFMILGELCTRKCRFCDVKPGKPLPPNPEEPQKVAEAVRLLNLKHCVLTSVTRDDLPDYGAKHWAETIRAVKEKNPGITIEALIPDMHDRNDLLEIIAAEKPEIISHNIETIKRLYRVVRPQSNYERILRQLKKIRETGCISKSGFMLGMGETIDEVKELMNDLLRFEVEIITIGQYLPPSPVHFPLHEYVHPDVFKELKIYGEQLGFRKVVSAPLVRSSYHSADQL
ncbi:MAG: lipoyl synthase [Sphingobacteriales bacterium]|nr:lipoyl synthase [Sphingobacteriales bacterium]